MFSLAVLALHVSWRIVHHVVHVMVVMVMMAHVVVVVQPLVVSSSALFTLFIYAVTLSSRVKVRKPGYLVLEVLLGSLINLVWIFLYCSFDSMVFLLRTKTCSECLLMDLV